MRIVILLSAFIRLITICSTGYARKQVIAKPIVVQYTWHEQERTGGFCWWQKQTSDYSIRNTPFMNGKGDRKKV